MKPSAVKIQYSNVFDAALHAICAGQTGYAYALYKSHDVCGKCALINQSINPRFLQLVSIACYAERCISYVGLQSYELYNNQLPRKITQNTLTIGKTYSAPKITYTRKAHYATQPQFPYCARRAGRSSG